MRPLLISKANTALQIALAVWILAELGYGQIFDGAKLWLIYLVGISTILSGGAYIVTLFRGDMPEPDSGSG